jgi:hypothetical protein
VLLIQLLVNPRNMYVYAPAPSGGGGGPAGEGGGEEEEEEEEEEAEEEGEGDAKKNELARHARTLGLTLADLWYAIPSLCILDLDRPLICHCLFMHLRS